ncbi:hypothetical protein [Mycobacterium sp. 852002-51961_SCH5331710]|uniref:hypothetical protein n=1 Tax=Mycobacterium sp. 852002-51961_SCH5331710 TaxID=1834105 RepID=UPI0009EF3211|nr:hypothetical protein [Mycobacterium sp. 852002-51961_SCH5331710]
MPGINHRWAAAVPIALIPFGSAVVSPPGLATAAECGPGTVYDALSNTCVVAAPAPPPPPPPPPPPAWNGDVTPYFSVGVCVPIPVPFAPSVCASV